MHAIRSAIYSAAERAKPPGKLPGKPQLFYITARPQPTMNIIMVEHSTE